MQLARRRRVPPDEIGDVEARDRAVLDHPSTCDHHPVGAMRAAQHQRRHRIAAPEKRNSSSLNNARSAGLPRRSRRDRRGRGRRRSRRSPSAARRDGRPLDAVAAALQQKSGAHFLHQIGAVVRGRSVDAESDGHARLFQLPDRAIARASTWLLQGQCVTAMPARARRAISRR